jgi:amidase
MDSSSNGNGAPMSAGAAPGLGGEVFECSIADLGAAMTAGSLTSEAAVRAYIERIRALDQSGPRLGSVIEINPDAESIARELDAERRAKGPRGPLHGVPILLKDNVDTADRMRTAAGSLALADSTPQQDSGVAARLRAAGAVLLGKANMSEWANFRSSRSTSGWSGRGGQCRNPYALDRSPRGSSSGSGAASAASLCAAAVGTETDGSIVSPASANGVVGFKPTVGLVSRAGIIPIAHSQDTAGPMTRTVADAVLLLAAMQGPDPRDPATAEIPPGALIDPTEVLGSDGLRGARLGVVRNLVVGHPEMERQFEALLDVLREQGAEVVDGLAMPRAGEWRTAENEVLLYEFKHGLNAYLGGLPDRGQPRDLAELIEFNLANPERSMPIFGQELLLAAQAKGPLSEPAYLEALASSRRMCREEGIDALLDEHGLDALVCPTTGPATLIDHVHGDARWPGSSSAGPAAVAGYPHATVPAGMVHGLPWGLSMFSTAWRDARVLRYAYAFEQASRARRAPRLLPSAEVWPGTAV